MGVKCDECGHIFLPPRPICSKCYAKDLKWIELRKVGRLLTYTVIHVPPKSFESIAPYVVGVIKLEEGPQLLGMIRDIRSEDVRIGMNLTMDIDPSPSSQWPRWPRYFFKPLGSS